MFKNVFILILSLNLFDQVISVENKYTSPKTIDSGAVNLRTLDRPFRMAKLNLLWTKARHRLPDTKLPRLFDDLKLHDKEEIEWKHMKKDGKDKDGLIEAGIRKKLLVLMERYGLTEHFDVIHDREELQRHRALNDPNQPPKAVFKDKKLNKLWQQAEHAGFTSDELKIMREEFQHHQEKIDEYHSLFQQIDDHGNDMNKLNAIDEEETDFNDVNDKINDKNLDKKAEKLRAKHNEILDGYHKLKTITSRGLYAKEFIEPKVNALWQVALHGNFSDDELKSLYEELKHYDSRLQKLKILENEAKFAKEDQDKQLANDININTSTIKNKSAIYSEKLQEQTKRLMDMHRYLEKKIGKKHMEL